MSSAAWRYFPAALQRTSWSLESGLRWQLAGGVAVGAQARREIGATEATLALFAYF